MFLVAAETSAKELGEDRSRWARCTFVNQDVFTLPDVDCGTVDLHEEMVSERVQSTTYSDKAGDPVKIVAFIETVNVPAATTTVSGSSFHFIEAAEGRIYAEVGHKILVSEDGSVLFQAGQDDLTQTDLQGLGEPLA